MQYLLHTVNGERTYNEQIKSMHTFGTVCAHVHYYTHVHTKLRFFFLNFPFPSSIKVPKGRPEVPSCYMIHTVATSQNIFVLDLFVVLGGNETVRASSIQQHSGKKRKKKKNRGGQGQK